MQKYKRIVAIVALFAVAGVYVLIKPKRPAPKFERAVIFSPEEVMTFEAVETPTGQKVIVTPSKKRERGIASKKAQIVN